ncbi:MAG: hypothetical protein M3O70_00355 [Actinomycetota bacterium]|nr:hypothetical protein [Actinomycetota bacterium]
MSEGDLGAGMRCLDEATAAALAGEADHEASIIIDEDTATARRLAAYAVKLGRRFGVPELEMVGHGLEGAPRLRGLVLLLSHLSCEKVRDYDRAGQWCGRGGEFCERHGIGILLGVCRAKSAGVLTWQGRWEEAEKELRSAVEGRGYGSSSVSG